MPVQPTYPGVYIEELPSGVRTIAGVSTSVAVFLGRTRQGPMNLPVLCLSFPDFERVFSSEYADSDLARQVRLFFENGGTRCYVMRIAKGAVASKVTVKAENETPTLEVTAKSAGVVGDKIRFAVTYAGPQPESAFNLEVFRWGQDAGGNLVKLDAETFTGLSMDPASPRYVEKVVKDSSKLVKVKDLNGALPAGTKGFSRSGRPVVSTNATELRDAWKVLLGADAAATVRNKLRISVDGGPFIDASLKTINFATDPDLSGASVETKLPEKIAAEVNKLLPAGSQVTVAFVPGPLANSKLLQVESVNGDVRIDPSGDDDLTGPLMLGTAQGGLEVSRYAARRPAPGGIVLLRDKIADFAGEKQTAFNTLTVSGKNVPLGTALKTTAGPNDLMLKDNFATSPSDHSDGVREKLGVLQQKVNEAAQADPSFGWRAEVWGSRLALLPTTGADSSVGTIATSGADGVNAGSFFLANLRYYSLAAAAASKYQNAGTAGNDGSAPKLPEYRAAFEVLRKEIDLFNLLLLPADRDHTPAERAALWGPASAFCQQQRAFLLIDAPDWADVQEATHPTTGVNSLRQGVVKDHAALFYPRVTIPDNGGLVNVGASGAIAGVMARIDASRGVWKAPAGTEADIRGIVGLERRFSDLENGVLNPRAINTLRIFSSGIVNWGARTLDGDDDFGSQWKYVPVRRLALYIEESLYRGTQWVVFEPNDEPLWAQIRLNVGAFMNTLFRQGAFQGTTPREAYLVKCDRDTTTQDDVNRGIVNILVGFAPLKPAEFVILKIQQLAGQVQA